ncbi:hypothetical protein [Mesorhizobium sp.]|uniref:hypothetical protein n=1 Tax=Mesorhizobium sp. TaxID=1871066 RepID=UPI00257E9184|nr:hypothetical protein [Mesorhizobium sp.]
MDTLSRKNLHLKVAYTNWRGETSLRTITPDKVYYGATEWHPEPQWLLTAYDHDKLAVRDFALKGFGLSPNRERELLEANNRYQQEARDARAALKGGYQDRVHSFMLACFGEAIAADGMERNHRFLEESLELVQALGCTASEAHQLVDYVFGRPVGEPNQETGGTLVTLAALCNAHKIDMDIAGETELTRCWSKIDKIRAKWAAKPKHGPLPAAIDSDQKTGRAAQATPEGVAPEKGTPLDETWKYRIPESLADLIPLFENRVACHRLWAEWLDQDTAETRRYAEHGIGPAKAHWDYLKQYSAAKTLIEDYVRGAPSRDDAVAPVAEPLEWDELKQRILGALDDCRDQPPEDEGAWEGWFHASFDLASTKIGKLLDEATAVQASPVEGLVEALEPFVAVANAYSDQEDDSFEPWKDVGMDPALRLKLSAFRKLRALTAALSSPQGGVPEGAIRDIAAERQRQIDAEGCTPEHDDEHGALIAAEIDRLDRATTRQAEKVNG